jgi:hypothetical protein
MRRDVLIREVDDEVYRRAKAVAALRGISMGSAVSEALENWGNEKSHGIDEEYRKDLEFVRKEWKQLRKHQGKAIVIASQKIKGVFDSYNEAREFSSKFKVALTFVVDENSPEERDIEIGPELEVQS